MNINIDIDIETVRRQLFNIPDDYIITEVALKDEKLFFTLKRNVLYKEEVTDLSAILRKIDKAIESKKELTLIYESDRSGKTVKSTRQIIPQEIDIEKDLLLALCDGITLGIFNQIKKFKLSNIISVK